MRSSGAEAGVVPGNLKPASRFLMQKGLPGEGDNLTLLQSGVITRQRASEREDINLVTVTITAIADDR